jgi:hypothetical protein
LEQRPDTPGLAVQPRIGQIIPFCFSIDQIGIGPLFRLLKGSPAKDVDERGKFHDWISKVSLHRFCPEPPQGSYLRDHVNLPASLKPQL